MKATKSQVLLSINFWMASIMVTIICLFSIGLSSAIRSGIAGLILITSLTGAAISYSLARTRLRNWQATIIAISFGFFGIIFHIGNLSKPANQLLHELIFFRTQVIDWIRFRTEIPNINPVLLVLFDIFQRTATLLARVWVWTDGIITKTVYYDPVAQAFVWSLLVFFLTYWAGWILRRYQNPLVAFIPLLAILAIITDYTGQGFISILFISTGILILMGFSHYQLNRFRWQMTGVDFSESIPIDTGFAIILLSSMLTTLAWITPSFSVRAMAEAIRDIGKSHDTLAESFGLEPAPVQESDFAPYTSSHGLPRSHLIGSGPELNHITVMAIKTGELATEDLTSNPPAATRHFWRSLTYDIYTGSGWSTSPVDVNYYQAGDYLFNSVQNDYRKIEQEVTMEQDLGGQLHWAGQLLSIDRDFQAAWRKRPASALPQSDPFLSMDMFGALSPARTYTAVSLEINPTQEELRSSTGAYPASMDKFMTLPDSTPERVLSLARDLTATEMTPYDRALAIETYLRNNFPYTLDVPAPPPGRDVADFFLFDLKKGYCDYYATAMAVLARAAGLPARLVSGFASGTYNPSSAKYIITEADAHTWVEIYFTGIGWVEFEPTAGLPPISRQNKPLPTMDEGISDEPLNSRGLDGAKFTFLNFSFITISLLFLFVLIAYLSVWVESALLFLQPDHDCITKTFRRMEKSGSKIAGFHNNETPYEFSRRFISNLFPLFSSRENTRVFEDIQNEINLITSLYVLSSYSNHPIDRELVVAIIRAWRRLKILMLYVSIRLVKSFLEKKFIVAVKQIDPDQTL